MAGPVLRQPEVLELLCVGRQTLWKWRREGWFPQGFVLNRRGDLGWHRSQVLQWLDRRAEGLLPQLAPDGGPVVRSAPGRDSPSKRSGPREG